MSAMQDLYAVVNICSDCVDGSRTTVAERALFPPEPRGSRLPALILPS